MLGLVPCQFTWNITFFPTVIVTLLFTRLITIQQYSFGNSTDTRTLTVTDNAGNNDVSDNIQISISKTDTESPVVSSFSANDTSVTLNTSNTQSQLVTFTATVTDNLSVNSVSLPNTSFVSSSGNTYTFSKLFEQDQFSFGNTIQTYTLTATDSAGNSSTATESITISKTDTSGPNITSFTSNNNNFSLTTSNALQKH